MDYTVEFELQLVKKLLEFSGVYCFFILLNHLSTLCCDKIFCKRIYQRLCVHNVIFVMVP